MAGRRGEYFWTPERIDQLRQIVADCPNVSAREIDATAAEIMGTTAGAIANKRSELKLLLPRSVRFRPRSGAVFG